MVESLGIVISLMLALGFLGLFLPPIVAEFDGIDSDQDIQRLEVNTGDTQEGIGFNNALKIVGSVFLMFFWTFGQIPVWLDVLILFGLRLPLLLFLINYIPFVGS